MTDPARCSSSDRLLLFAVGGKHYAIPIADVAEVTEVGCIAAVPTLRAAVGGVMNHHGDALPVIRPGVLFELGDAELPEPQNLLVLAKSKGDPGRVGLPVDCVHGLADGAGGTAQGADAVVECRPIGGRLVSVVDPQRLLMRAVQAIEESVMGADAMQGGEA